MPDPRWNDNHHQNRAPNRAQRQMRRMFGFPAADREDAALTHIHLACVGPRFEHHDAFVAQLKEIRNLPTTGLTA